MYVNTFARVGAHERVTDFFDVRVDASARAARSATRP